MRRTIVLVPVVVLVLGMAFAPSAVASDTYHGAFVSGTGVRSGVGVPLDAGGTWNVNIGSNGTQVTGQVAVIHAPCAEQPMPCPFNLPLTMFVWDEGAWINGTFQVEGVLDLAVDFDATLSVSASTGGASLSVEIEGCPYGWTHWEFVGVPHGG